MKKYVFALTFALVYLSSCKDECKLCTTEIYYNGEEQKNLETEEVYCGEALEAIESEPNTMTVGPLKRVRSCE